MLEARAEELAIKERVIFTGRLPNIKSILNMADVAILPSRFEGFPFALLEAMACKLSVIASRVGGIPEMVQDKVSGLLIETANVQKLADSLSLLYMDELLRNKLRTEAQITVSNKSSLNSMMKSTLKIYENLLDLKNKKALM
jgi:glycosyltransferase involved in cell wall biosynthesis